MKPNRLNTILEAAILAAGEPVGLDRLAGLFTEAERPSRAVLERALAALESEYRDRGVRLKCVASGYCFQTPPELSIWVQRLWPQKALPYSRAFLETLAIVAYKQPVTRGDIEAIRGVSVSPNIIRSLLDQEWIRVAGQREVPGRPNLYVTTQQFLDHFNLRVLAELPPMLSTVPCE